MEQEGVREDRKSVYVLQDLEDFVYVKDAAGSLIATRKARDLTHGTMNFPMDVHYTYDEIIGSVKKLINANMVVSHNGAPGCPFLRSPTVAPYAQAWRTNDCATRQSS